jgi:2-isopropylmalate synthase
VRIQFGGKRYNGRGLSTDVVEASVRAYLAAINVMAQESEDAREPDNGT